MRGKGKSKEDRLNGLRCERKLLECACASSLVKGVMKNPDSQFPRSSRKSDNLFNGFDKASLRQLLWYGILQICQGVALTSRQYFSTVCNICKRNLAASRISTCPHLHSITKKSHRPIDLIGHSIDLPKRQAASKCDSVSIPPGTDLTLCQFNDHQERLMRHLKIWRKQVEEKVGNLGRRNVISKISRVCAK